MLIRGDARQLPLVDECVDCVVTSPPYFGLRDYGHRGQIGRESSPAEYVTSIVAVFAELRRVLKESGTVWANFGDSYNSGTQFNHHSSALDNGARYSEGARGDWPGHRAKIVGLKTKDLVGIPWRVAFALQGDGWYLRSDIIWSKPNPMPESVTDRPTKAHEYLFLLTKSERYFYDAQAIAEPVSAAMLTQTEQGYDGLGLKDYEAAGVQNPSSVKARIIAGARQRLADSGRKDCSSDHRRRPGGAVGFPHGLMRNKRTVWTIPTMPYVGAHFATMPEKLVEPCILAGCPLGGLVLDPFVGSGTVGAVAERLGRRWVGVDLGYQPLAQKRTTQRGLRFAESAS